MRSFIKKLRESPAAMAMLAFALIILIQIPFVGGDPYDLTDDLIWGPPGETRKSALAKLEGRDETLLSFVNELKNAAASSTAPSSPSEGQFWFDTSTNEMKQYYASTWTAIYAFATTTEAGWAGSFSAPYASFTDVDVVSAEIGSATVGTLTTSNWSQNTASFNTLTAINSTITNLIVSSTVVLPFEGVFVRNSGSTSTTTEVYTDLEWDTELYDTNDFHYNSTDNTRLTIPSGVSRVIVTAGVYLAENSGGTYRDIMITKNGISTYYGIPRVQGIISSTQAVEVNLVSPVLEVSPSDYFEVTLRQDSGGTLAALGGYSQWFALRVVK